MNKIQLVVISLIAVNNLKLEKVIVNKVHIKFHSSADEDVEAETKRHEAAIEALHKQRLVENSIKSENADADADEQQAAREAKKLANVLAEKRREARARKREEFEKAPSNFLFSDEQLWEMLSSSSSGDETEEESKS